MFRGLTGLARRTLRVASLASASGFFARGHGGPVHAFALANRMNLLNVDKRGAQLWVAKKKPAKPNQNKNNTNKENESDDVPPVKKLNLRAICSLGKQKKARLCLMTADRRWSTAPVKVTSVRANTDKTDVWKDTWEKASSGDLSLVGWELFSYTGGGIEYVIIFQIEESYTLYAKIHLDNVNGKILRSVKVGRKSLDPKVSKWGIHYTTNALGQGSGVNVAINLWALIVGVQRMERAATKEGNYNQATALSADFDHRSCFYFNKRNKDGTFPPAPTTGNYKLKEMSIPLIFI